MSLPTNTETSPVPGGPLTPTRRITVGQMTDALIEAFPDVGKITEEILECGEQKAVEAFIQDYKSDVDSVVEWCEAEDLDPINKADVIRTASIILAYMWQGKVFGNMITHLCGVISKQSDELANIKKGIHQNVLQNK